MLDKINSKKILFIPLVNVLNVLLWGVEINKIQMDRKRAPKAILYFVGSTLPAMILYILASISFPQIREVLAMIGVYLVPICSGIGFIQYKKRTENKC